MLCKRSFLSAVAALAAVASVSALPQNFDINQILAQANAAVPGLNSILNNPAFMASFSAQMASVNNILASNPNFFNTFLNGINIPTDLFDGINLPTDLGNFVMPSFTIPDFAAITVPTNFLDLVNGDDTPSTSKAAAKSTSKPAASKTGAAAPTTGAAAPTTGAAAKQTTEVVETDAPANGDAPNTKTKTSGAAGIKPAAGLLAAGLLTVVALF
ncbi:hypothetical protein GGI04_003922 [Coemansia thaxteri]|uniref:Uncharacterized protein n=1 Tax=Coemansia thaxteri TaxID=2663907 RepID=A0A9W8EL77_9FUNG|nr:hypothetical protein GGI04_003922 [Coemansia thaxteri]KAJ2007632.1 hypothetical protein H4R26_000652 [Coemansia thaxteri]KAJ2467808.1 hypothetical protein GGI02_003905 [Coemansia sp. RSA 2322]KAJ2484231.1 hypothetical protein EV174_002598 [Coemansia sp. RSA 2320]